MTKISKLKKNLTYQTIYQIIITITPLITAPYLSRKLGVESLGIYSFTQSIVNYFMILAMLGFVDYGTRTIALCQNEEEEKKTFTQIYLVQLICGLISLSVYIVLCFILRNNTTYLLLQSFWIISCLFDVTWYFFGKEEYKTTVSRNIFVKIVTVCLILLLIKRPEDLYIYIMIMSVSTFISQFILWIFVRKAIKFKYLKIKESFKAHFKSVVVLFLPYLAMSIYHIMDKTMLGALSSSEQSGLYYNSDKVVNIPLGILNGLGTVMLSRVSVLQKDEDALSKISKVVNLSITGIMGVCIAFSFGIAAVCKDFVPIFFGEGYEGCVILINIFSIVIIFKALAHILRTQYLIPFKKEKYITMCVILGAIINVIANYVLIKVFELGALGATIGTLIAEAVVCIAFSIVVNKNIKIYKTLLHMIAYVIIGICMFIIIKFISMLRINILLKLLIEISAGGLFYLTISFIYLKAINSELISFIKIGPKKSINSK